MKPRKRKVTMDYNKTINKTQNNHSYFYHYEMSLPLSFIKPTEY